MRNFWEFYLAFPPAPSGYGFVCVQQWVKLDSPVSRLSLFTEKSQSILKTFSTFWHRNCENLEINVSSILSTYASTVKYFITFQVLFNYVSPAPIIKFADLYKACQTSKGGGGKCRVAPLWLRHCVRHLISFYWMSHCENIYVVPLANYDYIRQNI